MFPRPKLWFGLLVMALLGMTLFRPASGIPTEPSQLHEVQGVIHSHSKYSDGSGTIDEMAKAANEAKLDFLILTDHDKLWALKEGREGWHDTSLLLVGQETTTPAGHLLTFDVPADFSVKGVTSTQAILDKVKQAGGFAYPAHPVESHYPWKEWNVTGFSGFEAINLAELLDKQRDAIKVMGMDMIMRGAVDYPKIFRLALSTYPKAQLEAYDQITNRRKLILFGGADAHARVTYMGEVFNIPPYRATFEAMRTHLLLPEAFNKDLAHDKKLVYDALTQGHSFVGYDSLGDTRGFRFYGKGAAKSANMWDSLPFERGVHLAVLPPEAKGISPDKISLRILRNSMVLAKSDGKGLSYEPDRPGAYRAEVWLGTGEDARPWIFSNPIYLTRGE